jgi:hypothetical protein
MPGKKSRLVICPWVRFPSLAPAEVPWPLLATRAGAFERWKYYSCCFLNYSFFFFFFLCKVVSRKAYDV